jgi:hypothetical protein
MFFIELKAYHCHEYDKTYSSYYSSFDELLYIPTFRNIEYVFFFS